MRKEKCENSQLKGREKVLNEEGKKEKGYKRKRKWSRTLDLREKTVNEELKVEILQGEKIVNGKEKTREKWPI